MTSFILKGPISKCITVAVRASIYGFWKDIIQSITTQGFCNQKMSRVWRNFEEHGRESHNCHFLVEIWTSRML